MAELNQTAQAIALHVRTALAPDLKEQLRNCSSSAANRGDVDTQR